MINFGEYLFDSRKQIIVLLQEILMMLCIVGKYIQIPCHRGRPKSWFQVWFSKCGWTLKNLGVDANLPNYANAGK